MNDKQAKKPLTIARIIEIIKEIKKGKKQRAEDFTLSEIMTISQYGYYYDRCPECIFIPSYPQSFKFDLIVSSKNYGEIRIRIDRDIELSAVEGNKTALDKLEEIGKKQAGRAFSCSIPSKHKNFISYPFKDAGELMVALFQRIGIERTKELEQLGEFVAKVEHPHRYRPAL